MPKDNRSYSAAMRAYDDEKKFLRRIRHRAFHPDIESPLLYRLGGYMIRLIIFLVVVSAILFVRNRSYFNGDGFSEAVNLEFDSFLHGEESNMTNVFWKGDEAQTSYRADGSDHAFFREIEINRATAKAKWRDLLLNEGWNLQNVAVGEANVSLKAGPTPGVGEPPAARLRSDSFFTADPNFGRTRFGEITLHKANFSWGPYWTSIGSIESASGMLRRNLGSWELFLENGVLHQNWLRNLKMVPDKPMKISVKDEQINLSNGLFTLGSAGKVSMEGIISLTETPELNLRVLMKTIDLVDILPKEFHAYASGLVDIEMTISGSPNRSDGIIFDGRMIMVEGGRLREIPILQTLSVVTPRTEMRIMPVRTGSTLRFKTRQGVLDVTDIAIKGGGAAVSGIGFKTSNNEMLDWARMFGQFSYQMDTSELSKSLQLESIKKSVDDEVIPEDAPEVGFTGEVRLGMPWELLDREEAYRDKHFTEEDEYGWLTLPLVGTVDEITAKTAKFMEIEWSEIAKKARTTIEKAPTDDAN